MTLPGGTKRTYAYDPLMRIKQITAKDPGQNTVLDYAYSYDNMDNITEKATEHGAYDYGYDDLYRLVSTDNPSQADEAYTYDGVGNRLTSAEHDDWDYNTNNELQAYDGVTFEYDKNGNTVRKTDNGVVTEYVYNTEDRLIEVRDGTGSLTASYYYDPFGRRLWKEVGGVRTYFFYADEGLVAEANAGGAVTKTYGYKPGSTWTTDPLFMKESGKYYFYHNDHLGTPQKMTAVNGAVVWAALYTSFGEAQVLPLSTVENNLRFAGQYFDSEIGFHYNYQRYYNPKVGRYNSRDPIKYIYSSNLFMFLYNNPACFTDPLGLDAYSNVPEQHKSPGDFIAVIYHFLNFFNAVNQTNRVVSEIDYLSSTVKCKEKQIASVCFDPGPPPRDAYVTLHGSMTELKARRLKCITIPIVGTKDCYKCTDEYKKKIEEQKELDREGEYLAQELIYKQLRKKLKKVQDIRNK